jgi:hypothetical protein
MDSSHLRQKVRVGCGDEGTASFEAANHGDGSPRLMRFAKAHRILPSRSDQTTVHLSRQFLAPAYSTDFKIGDASALSVTRISAVDA